MRFAQAMECGRGVDGERVPASASANGGYQLIHAFCKDLSLCRAVTRSSTKANGSTSIVSPTRSMPRNSCTGSAARNSLPTTRKRQQLGALEEVAQASYTDIVCGRVRLSSDYSEIKIRLKFAPDAGPSAPGERYTIACARDRYPQGRDQHRDHAFRINSFPRKSFGSSA